jgi:hypothetical protein
LTQGWATLPPEGTLPDQRAQDRQHLRQQVGPASARAPRGQVSLRSRAQGLCQGRCQGSRASAFGFRFPGPGYKTRNCFSSYPGSGFVPRRHQCSPGHSRTRSCPRLDPCLRNDRTHGASRNTSSARRRGPDPAAERPPRSCWSPPGTLGARPRSSVARCTGNCYCGHRGPLRVPPEELSCDRKLPYL